MQHKRNKKTRKRGSSTHGHGSKKKHRGAGSRGGRGKSGSGKRGDAKIMKVTKGNKKYLGKYGFTSKSRRDIKSINLLTIQNSLLSLVGKGIAQMEKDTFYLNIKDLGYNKLLSKGKVKHALIITADYATQGAIENVKKAGGQVILPATEKHQLSNQTKE